MNNRGKVILFYFITGIFWFSLYAYIPIFPTYIESKGISYSYIGLIIGSYGFAQMLLRIPIGIISDRLGKRKIFVMTGMVFAIISALGFWFFDSAFLILLSRFTSGIAASMWVVYVVMFSGYFKEQDVPKSIGYLMAVTTFSQMAAGYLGGIITDRFGGKASFLLAAAVGSVGILISLFVKETGIKQKQLIKTTELISVIRYRQLLIVSVLAIISQLLIFATTFGFTPVAAARLGADASTLGLLLAMTALPGIISGALSGSYFSRIFGPKIVISAGFLITAVSILLIPLCTNLPSLFITQMVGGFSMGAVFPLLMGLGIKDIPIEKRGSAMGFFQAVYGIGMFLGPLAVGISTDHMSLDSGFLIAGLIGIAGSVMAYILINQKNNRIEAPYATVK